MAVAVRVVMNSRFLPEIEKQLNSITKEIANELKDEIKTSISVPYPPASKPGNPPHKRSGTTMRNIIVRRIASMDWAVIMKKQGTGKENLGIWLELGTGKHRQTYPPGSTGAVTGEYASPGKGLTSMHARPHMLKILNARGKDIAKSKFKTMGAGNAVVNVATTKAGVFGRLFGRLRGALGF